MPMLHRRLLDVPFEREDSSSEGADALLDAVASKKLSFDDNEEDSEELDSYPAGEVSFVRQSLGNLGMDDDSMVVNRDSFLNADISECDESGLDLDFSPVSSTSPNTDSSAEMEVCQNSAEKTPKPKKADFATPMPKKRMSPNGSYMRSKRATIEGPPRTPIKNHRFKSRISTGGLKSHMKSENGIEKHEAGVNPFAEGESDKKAPKVSEDGKKRPANDMLRTPVINKNSSNSTPESGYGTGARAKHFRPDTVRFSIGSSPQEKRSSRYDTDFIELDVLGSGHYGRVTKARKRLDGVIYAVKRTQEGVLQTSFSEMVSEVYALSALESHPNVLRYFTSWVENGCLFIQSEYCDARNLQYHIEKNKNLNQKFEEDEIRRIIRQTANGLSFLHDRMLAHLDVKPENILLSNRRRRSSPSSPEDDHGQYVYKIGDLGHVRSFRCGPVRNYVEGDRRYLAPELLHDMKSVLSDAAKADVYSLGITIFETASVGREAGVDSDGVMQRNGIVPGIKPLPLVLNQLIQKMTALEPAARPSMFEVVSDAAVHVTPKSCSDLQKELEVAHMENMVLTKKLINAGRVEKRDVGVSKPKILAIGRAIKNRSVSTQF